MADVHATRPSALRRFAQRAQQLTAEAEERCDLCSQPVPPQHRHLLEVGSAELLCVCMPCSILFDRQGAMRPAASLGQYRLVPDRRIFLQDFRLADHQWAALRIPVDLAYFVRSSPRQKVIAYYPSPLGPMESSLNLDAWQQIVDDNPLLQEMSSDVEALLVNRAVYGSRAAREHYLTPIADCYRLAGLLRRNWRGINGGDQVWDEIETFFRELRSAC